jgi:hypothetical protein
MLATVNILDKDFCFLGICTGALHGMAWTLGAFGHTAPQSCNSNKGWGILTQT